MINKWEIIPYPSEKYPDRYKVNISCDYADLKKIMDFYGKRCGLPWKSKSAEFSFSFYIYKMSPKGVEGFENKIKELQSRAESPQIIERFAKKTDREIRSSVFPPRSSKKQATSEELKIAKEISAIIDFDVFEPEKLEAIEIKKENKEQEIKKGEEPVSVSATIIQEKSERIEQRTISVGIVFRSGQNESSKIIEQNLLRSVAGKKLKYKIKVVFAKGFLVFSKDDINDVIAECYEKNVSSVIIAGESKLAEVLHETLNSAGIFTEHINTTDVNKKSLYFNIATSIILAETEKNTEQTRK
ncbi:MAG: hypothetical protein HY919_02510 [Elusimicrobia bacterium]|nr:hypothetical protein [Elusimicrobiota bacterium]